MDLQHHNHIFAEAVNTPQHQQESLPLSSLRETTPRAWARRRCARRHGYRRATTPLSVLSVLCFCWQLSTTFPFLAPQRRRLHPKGPFTLLSSSVTAPVRTTPTASTSSTAAGATPEEKPRNRKGAKNTGGSRKGAKKKQKPLFEAVKPIPEASEAVRRRVSEAMEKKKRKAFHPDTIGKRLLGDAYFGIFSETLPGNVVGSNGETVSPRVRREKPKGRPEMVPGAMKQSSQKKYKETWEAIRMLETGKLPGLLQSGAIDVENLDHGTLSNYLSTLLSPEGPTPDTRGSDADSPTKQDDDSRMVAETIISALVSTAAANGVKGAAETTEKDSKSLMTIKAEMPIPAKKARKAVKKNLPKRKKKEVDDDVSEQDRKLVSSSSRRFASALDTNLEKYYKTQLLSPQEEYTLGMKVNFMVKCEQVHEGVALLLGRAPTLEEWANACGFVEEEPSFSPRETDERLRPFGWEAMFEKIDPYMFVGNGLAMNAGPGRGKGRVKAPPPTKLVDFYDDSENKFRPKGTPEIPASPINRGTPSKFLKMIAESREAKQRMMSSNMRLVMSIARKYTKTGMSVPDLVQEGSLGLSRAAEKFEPKRGFKFSTYASWWIQQAVFRAIAYHSRTIRLPIHVHNLLNRVRKLTKSLRSELGRMPTVDEIALAVNMPTSKFKRIMRLSRNVISLETPKFSGNAKDLPSEPSTSRLGEMIPTPDLQEDGTDAEMRLNRSLFYEDLREMFVVLDEDEKLVISARYGMLDGLTRSVTVCAAQMNKSKQWVRSQECKALRKLRRPWYEKRLKEHQRTLASHEREEERRAIEAEI